MFDPGLVINRALVYGVLTTIVVGIYILVVGSLGIMFEIETGSLTISLLATVLVGILFQPLRIHFSKALTG